MEKITTTVFVFAVVVVLLVSGGAVAENFHPTEKTTRTVIDSGGIVFDVSVEYDNSEIVVDYENPTKRDGYLTGFVVRVDRQKVQDADLKLDSGEEGSKTIDFNKGIHANKNNHTIIFSTFGNHTQFNFTRKIESNNPGAVPTPYIADVTVRNGTVKGEPSAVANVTIVNPSEQLYSTKLFVHTTGTDGSLYPASVRPGNSRTIAVELLDDRGSKIGGEARLYTGNLTTQEGAMDQVEFVGRAGASTSTRNVSYEPVRPTWMNDHYQYRNDSLTRSFGEKLSGGYEFEEIPAIYPVVLLLLVVGLLRRYR